MADDPRPVRRGRTLAPIVVGVVVAAGALVAAERWIARRPDMPLHYWLPTGAATSSLVYRSPDGPTFEGWTVSCVVRGATACVNESRRQARLSRFALNYESLGCVSGRTVVMKTGKPGWSEYVAEFGTFPEDTTIDAELVGEWECRGVLHDGEPGGKLTLDSDGAARYDGGEGGWSFSTRVTRWGRCGDLLLLGNRTASDRWAFNALLVAADNRSAHGVTYSDETIRWIR